MAVKKEGLGKWVSDAAKGAAGNGIWAAAVLVGAGLVSFLTPVKTWLNSEWYAPGWIFILIPLTACIAGFLLGWLTYRREVQSSNEASEQPTERIRPHFPQPAFEPTDLQIEVIRALRYADGDWLGAEKIAELLKAGSVQDVEEALGGLLEQGWAADSLGRPIRYKLAGGGISYARDSGFLTFAQAKAQATAHKEV